MPKKDSSLRLVVLAAKVLRLLRIYGAFSENSPVMPREQNKKDTSSFYIPDALDFCWQGVTPLLLFGLCADLA